MAWRIFLIPINIMAWRIFLMLILAAAIGLSSCSEYSWDTLAEAAAHRCGKESRCTLNLSEVYGFDWSEAYIFRPGAEESGIEKAMGAKIPTHLVQDKGAMMCQSIFFLDKNKKVVRDKYSFCVSDEPGLFESETVPWGGFRFTKEGYLRLTRQDPALCVARDDQSWDHHVFFWFEPYTREHGCATDEK